MINHWTNYLPNIGHRFTSRVQGITNCKQSAIQESSLGMRGFFLDQAQHIEDEIYIEACEVYTPREILEAMEKCNKNSPMRQAPPTPEVSIELAGKVVPLN